MTTPMPAPPYAAPPGPWLRSPAALGRATVVLLGLVVATDLFACYADLLEMDVTGDLADGVTGAGVIHRADHADTLISASAIAHGVAMVATAVVFLCWLWRIRGNAEVFDASRHRMRRGWTIGAWFCPVVNLWFPRRIVADCWDASAPWGSRSGHGPVNAWWTLWLAGLAVSRFADGGWRQAGTADEVHGAAATMLFSDGLDIAAAVLAVVVVVRLTGLQERKVLSGELPAPFPAPAHR
ncbi:DUF4328 domain-containing protein [Streptomyces galbus]|uniref:DUF4328 domain-containing protein n=1 Tax=Streptomyces galbus TaxID=33898 RepID=A0A4U5X5E5_STRGB|nr:DUF4328 domain-containing protein [Streptomyces galbus]TKT10405.1 DUF4328 domain-containing protein [Streptomyces galbus]GHD22750.1 hypothetical protein GCM10010335_04320 [Streptomyces galbus]